jgi:putative ABC transport system permease protein
MFKNYLKIAYRNLARYKLFTFINVFGLAIGFAVCMIIVLWVNRELSYDRFHENVTRIYRIERELFRDNEFSRWPITSGAYKQSLVDDYPDIENAVRFWRREIPIKDYKNYVHRQSMFAVDNSIFTVFSFDLEEGSEHTALAEPMSVVLTRDCAITYFGKDDVIGKMLTFEWKREQVDFKVTGILKDIPQNSHIQFDMLISFSSYPEEQFTDWRSNYLYTYILADKRSVKNELEEQLKTFVNIRLKPVYGDLLSQGLGIHEVLKMHLVPLTNIHLDPSPNWEIDSGGSIESVYMFSSITILILLIACLNFMNLSTARAKKRAKEVSLRKTVGAYKIQLIIQFIQESVFLAIVALILALVLVWLFIPVYNTIFSEELSLFPLLNFTNLSILIGVILIIGIFAGLYPAFYLTKFEPIAIQKGESFSGNSKPVFRRNMVITQFIISIMLIIGTLTIYEQMRYMQTRTLGFEKENVVLLPARSQQVRQAYNSFRNNLLQNSQIQSLAVSSDLPGEPFYSNTNFGSSERPNDPVLLIMLATDYDFVQTYKLDMVAGRSFSKEFLSDSAGTIMLNEVAVRRFGWKPEEAIGKELSFSGNSKGKIVGVMNDFNFRSLHSKIEPMALLLYPIYFDAISVRILPGNLHATIDFIQQEWEATFPGEIFEFSFLDDRMTQLYENEMKTQNIFIIFSCFSIFVACLGLFGLSVFTATERTKEIGIRKVLGAPIGRILLLLSREFIIWVILANIIAWPLAYLIMNKWLEDFAYRVEMGWWICVLSGVAALTIALITISFHSIKAATANPVESLKYE